MDKNLTVYWLAMAKLFRLTALTCATYAKAVAIKNPELAMALDYEYAIAVAECRDCLQKARKITRNGVI